MTDQVWKASQFISSRIRKRVARPFTRGPGALEPENLKVSPGLAPDIPNHLNVPAGGGAFRLLVWYADFNMEP